MFSLVSARTGFLVAICCKGVFCLRVLFVDFRKAFEMIDHTVLYRKFNEYNFPPHISLWMLSFLSCRKQLVKVGNSVSEIMQSHA